MVKTRSMTNGLSGQAASQNKRQIIRDEDEEEYDCMLDPGYISQDDMFDEADITQEEFRKATATYWGLYENRLTVKPPKRHRKELLLSRRRMRWIGTKLDKKKLSERRQEREKRYQFLGYVFRPEEGLLIDHYLRKKCLGENLENCPIEEVHDVYACHPLGLTEKYLHNGEKVWYFFTRTPLKDHGTSHQGSGWISFGEKNDVIHEGKKVGEKQALGYCEGGHKTKYKMIVHNLETYTFEWYELYVCKLYVDGNSEDKQSQPEQNNASPLQFA